MTERLQEALLGNALPGELDGFGPAEQEEAAQFVASVAAQRAPGELAMRLESTGGEAGKRRMRLALINDDMPFLVDSVAGAIAAKCLTIHRLLHPILKVSRDAGGTLLDVDGTSPESIIYLELDRADARGRQELLAELKDVLADVRAAVADWREMTARMEDDAKAVATSDPEGAALLHWLAQNNFTLLGHAVVGTDGAVHDGLGILRRSLSLWDDSVTLAAIDELVSGRRSLLLLKADRISPVHRRVPLD
ncbi:MAG TPA: glutamate dehydrogenase, partial [Sphingomicrobium sp.]|nr:glutamate dehydrogenase [Sphingomicrobium sp.]